MNTDPQKSAQSCGCDEGAAYACAFHAAVVDVDVSNEELLQYARESVSVVATPAQAPTRETTIPDTPQLRKKYPVATGVLDYFPDAIAAVSRVSYTGNEQHNPGEPLHWARGKSMDQDDTMIRHFLRRGQVDVDGQRHSAKMVWRALAILQLELEAAQQEEQ